MDRIEKHHPPRETPTRGFGVQTQINFTMTTDQTLRALADKHDRASEILWRLRRRYDKTEDLRSDLRRMKGAAQREALQKKLSMSKGMGVCLTHAYSLILLELTGA